MLTLSAFKLDFPSSLDEGQRSLCVPTTCQPVHLPKCPSAYLFIYLLAYIPACLSICLPIYLPAYLPACLSTCLSTNLSIYLPVHQPTCLSTCLSIHMPVHLSTCPSTYLSIYLNVPAHIFTCLPCPSTYMYLSIYSLVYLYVFACRAVLTRMRWIQYNNTLLVRSSSDRRPVLLLEPIPYLSQAEHSIHWATVFSKVIA